MYSQNSGFQRGRKTKQKTDRSNLYTNLCNPKILLFFCRVAFPKFIHPSVCSWVELSPLRPTWRRHKQCKKILKCEPWGRDLKPEWGECDAIHLRIFYHSFYLNYPRFEITVCNQFERIVICIPFNLSGRML